MIRISVILCTRDPDPLRLSRTVESLVGQSLDAATWELLLIDNGSRPALARSMLPAAPFNCRIIAEPSPGLTSARLRGIAEAQGDVLVFVDDDNVLNPGYLSSALRNFDATPGLAAAGGPVTPEFDSPPPDWTREFFALLAIHDHGPSSLLAKGGPGLPYPAFAPVGAGLCLRRRHAVAYAEAVRHDPARIGLDRRAGSLTSGGDNDMVFTALHAGGDIAYYPELSLIHLIPASRLEAGYLARLNRAIQRSWVRVLHLHGQCPWHSIPKATVFIRVARAWLRTRAWSNAAAHVRFSGLRGRLEGQTDLPAR